MRLGSFQAHDPISAAVESHLRDMESEGLGVLEVEYRLDGVGVCFGGLRVRGETYDIALVRLAGTLLNDDWAGRAFLERIRGLRGMLKN